MYIVHVYVVEHVSLVLCCRKATIMQRLSLLLVVLVSYHCLQANLMCNTNNNSKLLSVTLLLIPVLTSVEFLCHNGFCSFFLFL